MGASPKQEYTETVKKEPKGAVLESWRLCRKISLNVQYKNEKYNLHESIFSMFIRKNLSIRIQ